LKPPLAILRTVYTTAIFALLLYAGYTLATPAAATNLCPSAKTGDHAPACAVSIVNGKPIMIVCAQPVKGNDMVRTVVAGVQVWEPFATLTSGSPVVDCSSNTWTSAGDLGIPLFSSLTPPVPLPVTPSVVVPPIAPAAPTQSVTVTAVDAPAASALFPGLPIPACIKFSNGVQSVTACIPAKPQ
jgi:hypothetical protein